MTEGLVFLLVSLVLLTVLGLAVLAPLRTAHRGVLLPAAPLLGAALLAVVLSTTSYLLPARGGLLVALLVAAVLVVVGVLRGTRPWRAGRGPVGLAVLALGLGVPGVLVALVPSRWAGTFGAMSPNQSHDIFYYVSEAAWLATRAITPQPHIGIEPVLDAATPGYASLATSLSLPLRIGQPMVQAALNSASGQDAAATAMAVQVLWVLLVAPAAFVTARLLRLGTWAAAALALVSASSALLVQQVYQQNVDALLGTGLALLTIGTCVAAAHRRIPVWPAALALSALVSVYTEYALYVGPAVVGGIVLTRRTGWWRRVVRAAAVVGLAVAISPTSWVRGLGTVLIRRDGDLMDSPLFSDGWALGLARAVGTLPLASTLDPGPLTWVLVVLIGLGLVLSLVVAPHRGTWVGLLGVGLGYVAVLTAGHHGYTQMRAVSLLWPLLLLASVAGWAGLGHRVLRSVRSRAGRRGHAHGAPVAARRAGAVLVVALTAGALVLSAANLRAAPAGLDRELVAERTVGAEFDEAAGWVAERGGDEGAAVTVLAPDFFDQMWVAYALRDDDLVSYVSLRPDYLGTGEFWAGETDRWLLVGRGAAVDAPPGAVVAENDRFRLLDTSVGAVTVAVPGPASTGWYPFAVTSAAGENMVGPDLGTVLVWRSAQDTGSVALDLRVPVDGSVRVTVGDDRPVDLAVVGQEVTVPIGAEVPSGTLITVDLGADGQDGGTQFELEGVHRAG